ncbi:MAG: phosphotransferase [Candidatus Acidiferrales bacterium]
MRSVAVAREAAFRFQGSADMLEEALRIFLGLNPEDPLPVADHLRENGDALPNAVISWNAAPAMSKSLARLGHPRQHRFAILPSRNQPRWLLPLTSDRRAIDGFELYTPYSRATRLMKALVVHVRATGWEGWVRHSVLVAARAPLPIEKLVSEITGEKHATFAFSLGTPGSVQKLTVQVMNGDGAILGYLKMPLKSGAEQRLRHEADVLQKLHSFPKLRAHIPRLLFAGAWDGRYVVFQSAIDGEAGPVRLTQSHDEFLRILHSCEPSMRPGRKLVQRIGQRWNKVAPRLRTSWQRLGSEVLRIASRELDSSQIACGVQHGDFVPWNTRVHEKGLILFDWESAAWEAPVLWDKFHFLSQTECHLNLRHDEPGAVDIRDANRALYLLYILNSVAQLSDEEAVEFSFNYREKQLREYLSGSAQTAVAD